jgi:hypothetical protein
MLPTELWARIAAQLLDPRTLLAIEMTSCSVQFALIQSDVWEQTLVYHLREGLMSEAVLQECTMCYMQGSEVSNSARGSKGQHPGYSLYVRMQPHPVFEATITAKTGAEFRSACLHIAKLSSCCAPIPYYPETIDDRGAGTERLVVQEETSQCYSGATVAVIWVFEAHATLAGATSITRVHGSKRAIAECGGLQAVVAPDWLVPDCANFSAAAGEPDAYAAVPWRDQHYHYPQLARTATVLHGRAQLAKVQAALLALLCGEARALGQSSTSGCAVTILQGGRGAGTFRVNSSHAWTFDIAMAKVCRSAGFLGAGLPPWPARSTGRLRMMPAAVTFLR